MHERYLISKAQKLTLPTSPRVHIYHSKGPNSLSTSSNTCSKNTKHENRPMASPLLASMANITSVVLFFPLATTTLPFREFDDVAWLDNLRFLVPQGEDYTARSVCYPALPNHTTISGQVTRSCNKEGRGGHVRS